MKLIDNRPKTQKFALEDNRPKTLMSKSPARKVWEALEVPEQKSREGLKMLANMVPAPEPTGNLISDVVKNTPNILANTVAEVAPSFISRGALLTAGALKAAQLGAPAIGAAGKWAGNTAERLSGIAYDTPGELAKTVKTPSRFFAKGLDAARKMYKGASNVESVREDLQAPLSHEEFVNKALELAKSGELNPDEALQARKSLDAIKKKIGDLGYYKTRLIFDGIAKKAFGAADEAYATARGAENMRNLLPLNKTGTPSIMKTALGIGGLMGGTLSPWAALAAPAFSPAVQGLTAAGIGVAGKALSPLVKNPSLGAVIAAALAKKKKPE